MRSRRLASKQIVGTTTVDKGQPFKFAGNGGSSSGDRPSCYLHMTTTHGSSFLLLTSPGGHITGNYFRSSLPSRVTPPIVAQGARGRWRFFFSHPVSHPFVLLPILILLLLPPFYVCPFRLRVDAYHSRSEDRGWLPLSVCGSELAPGGFLSCASDLFRYDLDALCHSRSGTT